jgi:hypothetical protein
VVGIFTISGNAEGAAAAGYNIIPIKIPAEDAGVGGYISGTAAIGKTAIHSYAIAQVEGNIADIGCGDGCATCIGF